MYTARKFRMLLPALAALNLFAVTAVAQNYPARPIRLIVPYPLGGMDASSEQGSPLAGCDRPRVGLGRRDDRAGVNFN